MIRRFVAAMAIASAALLTQAPDARAGGIYSTQAFADLGTPLANGSPTGDIFTASTLAIGDLVSTGSNTNAFAGMPTQFLGTASFSTSTGSNATLSFGNSVFGTFTSTSLEISSESSTTISFYVLGSYTPGTYPVSNGLTGTQPASFTISFTQNTPGGAISDSGTFSVPPAAIPEPSTVVLGLTSVVGCGLIFGVRRGSKKGTA
jgi:hypothetical protein